jgi:hypothetical protein
MHTHTLLTRQCPTPIHHPCIHSYWRCDDELLEIINPFLFEAHAHPSEHGLCAQTLLIEVDSRLVPLDSPGSRSNQKMRPRHRDSRFKRGDALTLRTDQSSRAQFCLCYAKMKKLCETQMRARSPFRVRSGPVRQRMPCRGPAPYVPVSRIDPRPTHASLPG